MKNIAIPILIFSACFFAACSKKGAEALFDKLPEERMAERNQELRSKLLENKDGWKAFIKTSAIGGGYGFYMKFNADETVSMYSDWNESSAKTVKNSTYSIRFIMNTSLIFDTYNYISIMQDPQGSVNGGSQPNGLQSDIEFEYQRSSDDTVVLRGKKYRNNLILIKATAAEASQYQGGQYAEAIDQFKEFFLANSNNYVSVEHSGSTVKMGMEFDHNNKTVQVQGKLAENTYGQDKQGFGYSIDGVFFINPISFAGKTFIAAKMKNTTTLVFVDESGKEYEVQQNPVPLTNLHEVFGSSTSKSFNSIYLIDGNLPEGVNSTFNEVYNGVVSRFKGTSRTVDTLEIKLTTNTTAHVRIWYWSGTTHFLADASFNYTLSPEGMLTFTNYTPGVSNGNWNTRIAQIGNLVEWLQSGPFRVDWVSSTVAGSPNYGGLYRVADDGDFYYGYLRRG